MRNLVAGCLAVMALTAPVAGVGGFVGSWDLTVAWPQGPTRAELVVSATDGELRAAWSGQLGDLEAIDPRIEGGELRFSLEVTTTTDGSTFTQVRLPFRATLDADRLSGTLRAPSGGSLKVEGARRR